MQVALAATMKSYGVQPGAVIGHSMGEAAAAVVAGALSLEDGVRVICRRSRLMSTIAGSGAMASVELPAEQVLSELVARGVDDVVVAVVASPQSTVIGGATQTVSRTGRGVGAARGDGPRGRRRRRIALPAGRPDPRRAVRCAGRAQPHDTGGSLLLRDRVRPARAARVRRLVLGGQSAAHRAVRRGCASGVGGRLPGLRGVGTAPATHPRGRADSATASASAGRTLRHAPRARAAARAARLPGRPARAGAAIDFSVLYPGARVDAPLPTWTHRPLLLDPQRSGFAGARRLHRCGAPADGGACAIARGAGAPRLAG